jgi:polyribonucleotide nucleotidyltransferase
VEQTGVKIDIEDDGVVKIASIDEGSANEAIEIIRKLTKEAELGEIYTGKIKKIIDSGVIVEILPGIDGYVHVSQLAEGYVKNPSEVVKEREEITVKVIEIDPNGRIKLSRKAALKDQKEKQ